MKPHMFIFLDIFNFFHFFSSPFIPYSSDDFVVINQTMLLDTSTPRLSFLLIKGGQLIFDRKDGIHLQVHLFFFKDADSEIRLTILLKVSPLVKE